MSRRLPNILMGHAVGLGFGIALGLALGNLAAGLPIGFLFGLSMAGDDQKAGGPGEIPESPEHE